MPEKQHACKVFLIIYIFFGTKDSVYQQIGNAVPPVLGRAVAEKVLEILGCREEYKKLRDIYEEMK